MKIIASMIVVILIPQVLWAGSCNKIAAPNLSDLGWTLFDQYAYDDERLGASISYDNGGNILTYYTYDLGLETIDTAIVEEQLVSAIRDIYGTRAQNPDLTSSDPMSMGEYVVNYMISADDYVHHAYIIESSLGDLRLIDAVTLGTDGSCIFKIRHTDMFEYPTANPLVNGMGVFIELAHEFFVRLNQ